MGLRYQSRLVFAGGRTLQILKMWKLSKFDSLVIQIFPMKSASASSFPFLYDFPHFSIIQPVKGVVQYHRAPGCCSSTVSIDIVAVVKYFKCHHWISPCTQTSRDMSRFFAGVLRPFLDGCPQSSSFTGNLIKCNFLQCWQNCVGPHFVTWPMDAPAACLERGILDDQFLF